MAIKLTTGQTISLRKESPGLKTLLLGLGWEVADRKGIGKLFQSDFDLDISVLCLNAANKISKSTDVIYYGNAKHPTGAIAHLGDELTGRDEDSKEKVLVHTEGTEEGQPKGEQDKEQIIVNLAQVPTDVAKLLLFANIYECVPRRQKLGQVRNAYVHLVDLEGETEIARYDLSQECYSDYTGVAIAEVYREEDKWQAAIIGEGVQVASLQQFVGRYS